MIRSYHLIGIVKSPIILKCCLSTKVKMSKQTCYAASKNKHVILDVFRSEVIALRAKDPELEIKVLEVASGTGEHAALFTESVTNLLYQPTEPQQEMHESIRAWTNSVEGSKVNPPISLDVNDPEAVLSIPSNFSNGSVDVMICINMIHISPFRSTHALFKLCSECLKPGGKLITYGPYRVNGEMVESNVACDLSLKQRNAEWGVRDLEAVVAVAEEHGITLEKAIPMPSNNFSLVFCKVGSS